MWKALQETSRYPDWNPFIRSLEGELVKGNRLIVRIHPEGGKAMTFKPVVLKAEFPEIRWKGQLLFKGFFDGEHYFRVESLSTTKSRLIHGETFSGFLVPVLSPLLKGTELGFMRMNQELKSLVENSRSS